MHYIQLHAITRFEAFYIPYTPCQGMFTPPNEASLTQTNPATAHLFPRPPSATNSSWFAAPAGRTQAVELPQTRFQSSPGRHSSESARNPVCILPTDSALSWAEAAAWPQVLSGCLPGRGRPPRPGRRRRGAGAALPVVPGPAGRIRLSWLDAAAF